MSAPHDEVFFKGKTYPVQAWRLIYRYITRRRAPDTAFHRQMTTLGLTRDEALELYRAQLYAPWQIKFVKKAPPEEELVGDEECSGWDIYYNRETRKYSVRDPETKELKRTEDKICLEVTASIKTSGGHDKPVLVEITCTTLIKEKNSRETINAAEKVGDGLFAWLEKEGWDSLLDAFETVGTAFNGEKHVQERGWYLWPVPDYPKIHVLAEKKKPRSRTYEGDFTVLE